jgi:hypothetical protein
MSFPSAIDNGAPVLAHHEVAIQASLEKIWRLHTDVNGWTTWQTDITAASIEGAFEVGNSFRWSSYGLDVTSTIYVITDYSRILWGGTGGEITGIPNGSSPGLRTVCSRRRMSHSRGSRLKRTPPTCSRCWMRRSFPGSIT